MFSVVEFVSDSSVEVVPTKWIINNEGTYSCPFPENRPKGIQKLQSQPDAEFNANWPVWEIIIVKSYGK